MDMKSVLSMLAPAFGFQPEELRQTVETVAKVAQNADARLSGIYKVLELQNVALQDILALQALAAERLDRIERMLQDMQWQTKPEDVMLAEAVAETLPAATLLREGDSFSLMPNGSLIIRSKGDRE